ncbi:type II toxin-antitoxin system HicA family toxin [Marinomonas piezotolerans]|uniref:Type II toxin-antitoxin system HicA family toxin n=1 Tax=Marinomonas piezotolerans TaxID=2213058 RepID=A0A370UAA1_9GAMM|nr:type II toxin-antitoxin system HicA family toxin [Marinomonas piezotolerans]RDL44694.1 type II toxin-antitoxin system HicA family toxin [Marinomonas piezotolerans]
MGKQEKIQKKIFAKPTCANLTWSEAKSFLESKGYRELQGDGSRVRFVHDETQDVIRLHKPHPGNELKKYAVEQLQEKLEWIR